MWGGSILDRGSGCQVFVDIGVKQTSLTSWLKNWYLMLFNEEFFPQEARQGNGSCWEQHQEPSLFVGAWRPETISPRFRTLNTDVVLLCCYGPSFQRSGKLFPSPLSTHHSKHLLGRLPAGPGVEDTKMEKMTFISPRCHQVTPPSCRV